MTFARIGNQDLEILILVENLLDTAIVAAFLLRSSLLDIFLVFVTQIAGLRNEVGWVVEGSFVIRGGSRRSLKPYKIRIKQLKLS